MLRYQCSACRKTIPTGGEYHIRLEVIIGPQRLRDVVHMDMACYESLKILLNLEPKSCHSLSHATSVE